MLDLSNAKKLCSELSLTYVYGIELESILYLCGLDVNTGNYFLYKGSDSALTLDNGGLNLLEVKFKRNMLIEMGGVML